VSHDATSHDPTGGWRRARVAVSALVLAACGAFAPGCEGRDPKVGTSEEEDDATGAFVLELDLSRGMPESPSSGIFGSAPGGSYADLVRSLRERSSDVDLKGVFVRMGTSDAAMHHAAEIGRHLAAFKARGIAVTCHADDLGNGNMLLAAKGCTSVWVSPAGGVEAIGPAFQLVFGKSLLAKIDADVDFEQVGKYKGAQEPYTRDEPSPEARESVESTIIEIHDAWLATIGEGRGDAARDAAEDGPWSATAAKEVGLIDAIGYVDEAKKASREGAGVKRSVVGFGRGSGDGPAGVDELLRALGGGDSTSLPHVAVLRATGAITMSGGGGLFGGSDGISEQALGKAIQKLAKDDAVKAVVLRLDSPGGSALASDLLWHQLMKLREKKPLIVSIGGMAASGGMYLACAGTRIFAEPTSIVGSIGVVGGKVSFKRSLAEIGVHVTTITGTKDPEKAARAAYMSPLEPWDDATRAKVRASMTAIYDLFLKRISEGRGVPVETIAASAEGRIFGGATARDRKLVDEMGGLDDAIRFALSKTDLGDDGRVQIVGEAGSLFELLDQEAAARAAVDVRREIVLPALLPDLPRRDLEAFGEALAPLASGERTAAAMPFALLAR
jgi:protease-4